MMGKTEPRQLLLQFQLDDSANFDNFLVTDANRPVVHQLTDNKVQDAHIIYLWGRAGAGKTHLLQAACHQHTEAGGSAICIPLADSAHVAPEILEGLENLDLVCLDDIDTVAGNPAWERALFGFYNRAQDTGSRLIAGSLAAPASFAVELSDLRSRLLSGLVFQLHELNDAEKAAMLEHRADILGFTLSEVVIDYLLQRHDRSTRALIEVLHRLDRQSLEQKRRVTIPLVRQVMGW